MHEDVTLIEKCRALYESVSDHGEHDQLSLLLNSHAGGWVVDARLGEMSTIDGWDPQTQTWIDGCAHPGNTRAALLILRQVLVRAARAKLSGIETALSL